MSGGARAISVPGHAGRSGMGSQAQNIAQTARAPRCSSSRRRSAHRDKLGAAVLAAAAAAAASPLASVTAALHLAAASL